MATKSAKSVKERAVEAALDLAAGKGWNAVTLPGIAKKARIPLHELRDHFDDRLDIITAWSRVIDRKVLKAAGEPDLSMPSRDRLFDILMERFDALNDNREGAKAILDGLRRDPKAAVIALPHLGRSMSWMLEAAGIETAGLRGALKITGLGAVYVKALRVWCDDDTRDMSKTMAALDQNLERASQWADSFGISSGKKGKNNDQH